MVYPKSSSLTIVATTTSAGISHPVRRNISYIVQHLKTNSLPVIMSVMRANICSHDTFLVCMGKMILNDIEQT